ncbi:galactose-1-phosphate uridylyltransferase [candidate division KSB1 bacterium]|nr:galactose-1-phosphate uridylyltransferase [candidate division KSB1 bacterium]
MPELRHDPIQKRWVIISTERSRRPSDFKVTSPPPDDKFCPFCEGNEDKTPLEIYSIRRDGTLPNTPGWEVRVVPNKFPALMIEGEHDRAGVGLYDRMNGIGAHEVIIEIPDHGSSMADRPLENLVKVFTVYKNRLIDLIKDRRFKYILIFKNHGRVAGASLSHPHTQIIATPVTPRTVAVELESARAHYQLKERCIFCDIIKQEIEAGDRIICIDENYVAIAPYASRHPFEAFVVPRAHRHDFGESTEEEIYQLAVMMKDLLVRLKLSLGDPPYNFLFHTAPNVIPQPRRPGYWETLSLDWHWHIEVLPRLTRTAGFEWGTGFYINPTRPEDAAKFLREVEV